jgi:hypothetical protein
LPGGAAECLNAIAHDNEYGRAIVLAQFSRCKIEESITDIRPG